MTRPPAHPSGSRVRGFMRSRALLLSALLAWASACGGKLSDKKTTPRSTGTVVTEDTSGAEDREATGGAPGAGESERSGVSGPGAANRDDQGRAGKRFDPFAPAEGENEDEEDATGEARDRKPEKPGATVGESAGTTRSARPSGGGKGPEGPDAERSAGQASGNAGASKQAAQPRIRPPDLDLPAADQSRRVEAQLATARRALTGSSKDPDRALQAARAALDVDATSIDAVVLMAHAYHAKRFDDTAEVMLDMLYRERERARTSPGVHYVYGLIYDATDRPERAFNAYYQAVQLDPTYEGALINLGAHYLRKKMFAEAAVIYERLASSGVKTAVVWTNLGVAYRGRAADFPAGSPNSDALLRQAETAFKRAMSVDRGYANVYYNLALLYLDADPFPGPSGPMDTLRRLGQARTYFEEYGRRRGADRELMNERIKDVDKLIKREKKRQKRASSGEDW